MLGPFGKAAKKLLSLAGYEIHRRTRFEDALSSSLWDDWFGNAPEVLASAYAANRQTLEKIDTWVEPDSVARSLWRYCIPELLWPAESTYRKTGLDDVEKEITYSDLLVFIGRHIENVSYLEIGVSVGKNFLQIVDQFPDGEVTGLDYEDLNPILAQQFDRIETVWQSDSERTVEALSGPAKFRTTEYRLHRTRGKPVTYIRGDQHDPETWSRLEGRRFNLIFSDGDHDPAALHEELGHIEEKGLLDEAGRFAMVWDDLNTAGMQEAFDRIAQRLPGVWHALYRIDGTFGNRRVNGVAANFRF